MMSQPQSQESNHRGAQEEVKESEYGIHYTSGSPDIPTESLDELVSSGIH